jgi:PIN domain nuclease of toxin-antitoxin system
MKFILATHTFLWFITDAPSLSSNAKELIENINNKRLLSIASIWEIAIKVSLGKLELAKPFEEFIPQQLKMNFIELLPIKMPHLAKVIKLPFHHRDPFDRLIISQSLIEQIAVISTDKMFDEYKVKRFW